MTQETHLLERIQHLFAGAIESKISAADVLPESILAVGARLTSCLLNNGKLFVCGNGGSAANALHFSTALMNRYESERPPLPVISLINDMTMATALIQDGDANHIFSRPIQTLGAHNDVLMVISTSCQTMNLVHAVDAAHEKGMDVVLLSGAQDGVLVTHLGPSDIALMVPGESVPRVREMHLFVLHCLCDLIEQSLFGQMMG